MRSFLCRVSGVAITNLVLFEVLMQQSVNWRESTEEFALLVQLGFLSLGLAWAVLPLFRRWQNTTCGTGFRCLAFITSFAAIHTAIFFYSWHIRPNVGLYEEPKWVAEHPAFQDRLRQKIEDNLWN